MIERLACSRRTPIRGTLRRALGRTGLAAVTAIGLLLSAPAAGQIGEPVQVADFGADPAENPGNLSMYALVPRGPAGPAPLVVLLHGCEQRAGDYARRSGWLGLAARHGIALVLAQQSEDNHPARCFNFFRDEDIRRTGGEAESIANMIGRMTGDPAIDGARVYVTGLSAGGSMAAVMLATYPELFKGGAIVAGTPYGCGSVDFWNNPWLAAWRWWWGLAPLGEGVWALETCGVDLSGWYHHAPWDRAPGDWGDLVRTAAGEHGGPWPVVAIWHGGMDRTVHADNLRELVEQWTDVHGIDARADNPPAADSQPYKHDVFRDDAGRPLVESWLIEPLGHAQPIEGAAGAGCGEPGPYVQDVGLCAALDIARFWSLIAE